MPRFYSIRANLRLLDEILTKLGLAFKSATAFAGSTILSYTHFSWSHLDPNLIFDESCRNVAHICIFLF